MEDPMPVREWARKTPLSPTLRADEQAWNAWTAVEKQTTLAQVEDMGCVPLRDTHRLDVREGVWERDESGDILSDRECYPGEVAEVILALSTIRYVAAP